MNKSAHLNAILWPNLFREEGNSYLPPFSKKKKGEKLTSIREHGNLTLCMNRLREISIYSRHPYLLESSINSASKVRSKRLRKNTISFLCHVATFHQNGAHKCSSYSQHASTKWLHPNACMACASESRLLDRTIQFEIPAQKCSIRMEIASTVFKMIHALNRHDYVSDIDSLPNLAIMGYEIGICRLPKCAFSSFRRVWL